MPDIFVELVPGAARNGDNQFAVRSHVRERVVQKHGWLVQMFENFGAKRMCRFEIHNLPRLWGNDEVALQKLSARDPLLGGIHRHAAEIDSEKLAARIPRPR